MTLCGSGLPKYTPRERGCDERIILFVARRVWGRPLSDNDGRPQLLRPYCPAFEVTFGLNG